LSYRLSIEAQFDLDEIYDFGKARFGSARADDYYWALQKTFALIAEYPELAAERREFRTRVRVLPHDAHIVIYQVLEDEIVIVRVCNAKEDWQSLFQ
jgi:toxin ParE1/3/4